MTALEAVGATDARVHGDVADGSEGVDSPVLIGVSLPPGVDPRALLVPSGHLGVTISARVTVVPHAQVPAYGWDDEGVPLTPLLRVS